MNDFYQEDLAFIHDVGFADYALKSAPGILEILRKSNISQGLVVDLGCGSGLLTQELAKADYQVIGIDISQAMIAIARRKFPDIEFRVGSMFQVDIPPCHAVISVSECLNYLFDPDHHPQTLIHFFDRIYQSLFPGGVFIFDIAEPGQVPPGVRTQVFTKGEDWIVLAEKQEDEKRSILTRCITSLRKVGEYYRRSDEVHHQQLYQAEDLANKLQQVGFQVKISHSYGQFSLPKAHAVLIANKSISIFT